MRTVTCTAAAALGCVLPAWAGELQSPPAAVILPEVTVTVDRDGGSLTVPTTDQATSEIQRTPGGVALVPESQFKTGPANTIKDVVEWVPGVVTQSRWGFDARVSIRGSGLTRNYGNRGVNFYMDGIPINTAEGLTDLFEVDPTAYRYAEVYKGGNALRFGANALGGAINFVWPTGHDAPPFDGRIDAGSFGYLKAAASTGGAKGPFDWFVAATAQRSDGYREHNRERAGRINANFGYRLGRDAETRFYVNANTWRARLPGEVTKDAALNNPRAANPVWVAQDQQRNIDSVRIANKTSVRVGPTLIDFGLFTHQRHVDHPIFRYLDYRVDDYGGFARAADERTIGGFRNRFVAGLNVHAGTNDYDEYANVGNAIKGGLLRSELQKSQNYSAYFENSYYAWPTVALVVAGQFLHAVREREDRFLADGDQTVSRTYHLFSPRIGVLWEIDPEWQVFANVSRSAEVPTFDSATFSTFAGPLPLVNAQRATTYETGTRGRRPKLTWDVAVYRSEIDDELQCLRTSPFSLCSVVNADRTVHQGIEIGLGIAVLESAFAARDRFWFNVAYTRNDFFFDADPRWGNNELPGVPPHFVRAEVLYRHPGGFFAGPSLEWIPRRFFADNANSLTVDPYALLHFRVGYDNARAGWSGYVEARNITDRPYISTAVIADIATPASELFNPGIGRAFFAGARFQW